MSTSGFPQKIYNIGRLYKLYSVMYMKLWKIAVEKQLSMECYCFLHKWSGLYQNYPTQDGDGTLDFEEFVKIMMWNNSLQFNLIWACKQYNIIRKKMCEINLVSDNALCSARM